MSGALVLAIAWATISPAGGEPPEQALAEVLPAEEVNFGGPIRESQDISAVETLGTRLVIGSDEGAAIQVLEPAGDGKSYVARNDKIVLIPGAREIDIEGMAREGSYLYVVGSHSIKRKRVRIDKSRSKNLERMGTISDEEHRHHLFRLKFDVESGELVGPIESVNLRPFLKRDLILGRFTWIPDKENGLNIEGLAVHGGMLYLGLRAPILRGGYDPVLVLSFDKPEEYEVRFVQLGGRSIRSMARVTDGFLLLAGFEQPLRYPADLFFWNGLDQIPGREQPDIVPRHLGEWPAVPSGNAEGMVVLDENERGYRLLIVHDGVADGRPMITRVAR